MQPGMNLYDISGVQHKKVSASFSIDYQAATLFSFLYFKYWDYTFQQMLGQDCRLHTAAAFFSSLTVPLQSFAPIVLICENGRSENRDLTRWPHILRIGA